MDEVFGLVFLGDVEDELFRAVEDIAGLALAGIRHIRDLGGGFDEPSEQGLFADDADIVVEVGGVGDGVDEHTEVAVAAGLIKGSLGDELVDEGDDVEVVAVLEEDAAHGLVDMAVLFHIKVFRADKTRDVVHTFGVYQQKAEDGLLRLERERHTP